MHETVTSERFPALIKTLQNEENIGVITEALLIEAMEVMNSDFASIQLYDATIGALILLGHKNFMPESEHFWHIVFAGSGACCGEALKNHKRAMVKDVDQVEYIAGTGDLHSFHYSGIRSCQSTPLISSGGNFVGMISTHWRTPHDFDKDDFESFDHLALIAANLLEQKK